MERAALLAISMEHKRSDLDLTMLWGNLDVAQQGETGVGSHGTAGRKSRYNQDCRTKVLSEEHWFVLLPKGGDREIR